MFAKDVAAIAAEMIGTTVELPGDRTMIVREADPFRRNQNESGAYRAIVDMEPGSVYVPKQMASCLLLVAALDHGQKGGCVLVRAIEMDGEKIVGPGRVTKAIGITEHRTTGKMEALPNGRLRLTIEGALTPMMPVSKGRRGKGTPLTDAELASRLARIGVIYQRDAQPGDTLEGFLRKVRESCATVEELDAYLAEQERC